MNEIKKKVRDAKIFNAAFELYTEKKIENVTILDVATKAGYGPAMMYKNYKTKLELAARTCAFKWREYFSEALEGRDEEALKDVDAIDRLDFTFDLYIDLYKNHKDLIRFNNDFNNFLHDNKNIEKVDFSEYQSVFSDVAKRFHDIYEKAKKDGTMRTDIPEHKLLRILLQSMMGTCIQYSSGFSLGADESDEYNEELEILKSILMNYARGKKA